MRDSVDGGEGGYWAGGVYRWRRAEDGAGVGIIAYIFSRTEELLRGSWGVVASGGRLLGRCRQASFASSVST